MSKGLAKALMEETDKNAKLVLGSPDYVDKFYYSEFAKQDPVYDILRKAAFKFQENPQALQAI